MWLPISGCFLRYWNSFSSRFSWKINALSNRGMLVIYLSVIFFKALFSSLMSQTWGSFVIVFWGVLWFFVLVWLGFCFNVFLRTPKLLFFPAVFSLVPSSFFPAPWICPTRALPYRCLSPTASFSVDMWISFSVCCYALFPLRYFPSVTLTSGLSPCALKLKNPLLLAHHEQPSSWAASGSQWSYKATSWGADCLHTCLAGKVECSWERKCRDWNSLELWGLEEFCVEFWPETKVTSKAVKKSSVVTSLVTEDL